MTVFAETMNLKGKRKLIQIINIQDCEKFRDWSLSAGEIGRVQLLWMLSVVMPRIDRGSHQGSGPLVRTAAASLAARLVMTSIIIRPIHQKLLSQHNST